MAPRNSPLARPVAAQGALVGGGGRGECEVPGQNRRSQVIAGGLPGLICQLAAPNVPTTTYLSQQLPSCCSRGSPLSDLTKRTHHPPPPPPPPAADHSLLAFRPSTAGLIRFSFPPEGVSTLRSNVDQASAIPKLFLPNLHPKPANASLHRLDNLDPATKRSYEPRARHRQHAQRHATRQGEKKKTKCPRDRLPSLR